MLLTGMDYLKRVLGMNPVTIRNSGRNNALGARHMYSGILAINGEAGRRGVTHVAEKI